MSDEVKIWRIGYIEDDTVHYTVPIGDPTVVSETYKSFDEHAIASGNDIWVESIVGTWTREG